MDKKKKRHKRFWRFAYRLLHRWFAKKFNYTYDICDYDGPCIIISNHVTNWDPPLLGLSFPKKPLYFMASEHLFRKGLKSWAINRYLQPIPRSKGASAADAVLKCLRHFKAGDSVCIFAEGDSTWNGVTNKIIPSTANLVKSSRVALLTYKFEGGHLSCPRWGKGVRKGKMHGRIVNVYPPEELKKMSVEEIEALINKDIFENAWERQANDPVSYWGKNLAVRIESALYLCPICKQIGTLEGNGDFVTCSCGFKREYTTYGSFEPSVPFKNIYEWDIWQSECLKNGDYVRNEEFLFSDKEVTLTEIFENHRYEELHTDTLVQHEDKLMFGEYEFLLSDISSMSLVQTSVLLFTHKNKYYEFKTDGFINLRKYLQTWQTYTEQIKIKEN